MPGLAEHLARSFNVEVVAPDMHSLLGESGGAAVGSGQLLGALPADDITGASPGMREFSTAVGLALSQIEPSCYSMDLVPAQEKKKRVFKERTVYLYVAGVVLLVFLMVRLVAAWRGHSVAQGRQAKIDTRLEEAGERLFALREVVKENTQLTSAIQHLAKATEPGNFMAELLFLTRKSEVTPREIKITHMQLRGSSGDEERGSQAVSVVIRGKVTSRTGNEYDVVRQFRDQLLKSEVVKSAEIDPGSTRMDRGEFRFEIVAGAGRAK